MGDFNRGGFRRDSGPRELHDATCSKCGNACKVPFPPKPDRPVYCRECWAEQNPRNKF
ncbi:hypothetical protein J4457_07640 [Candidatus Woesearchaeota archaeon]|nr:hypothetical protein [Candidatus Woesearchaeota archaeon]